MPTFALEKQTCLERNQTHFILMLPVAGAVHLHNISYRMITLYKRPACCICTCISFALISLLCALTCSVYLSWRACNSSVYERNKDIIVQGLNKIVTTLSQLHVCYNLVITLVMD